MVSKTLKPSKWIPSTKFGPLILTWVINSYCFRIVYLNKTQLAGRSVNQYRCLTLVF
jgi:hypothetical protein